MLAKKNDPLVIRFFLCLLLLGISIFHHYGVHTDEFTNQAFGERWMLFDPSKLSWKFPDFEVLPDDWFHGPFFEVLLATARAALGLSAVRDILLFRHLATFLCFYAGVVLFYGFCKHFFGSRKTALLGSTMLVLHPRIFADSFYNSRDIPMMVSYIAGLYTMMLFLEKPNRRTAVIHACACAASIAIRAVGLILPATTFLALALGWLLKRRDPAHRDWRPVLFFAAALAAFTLLFWPLLWQDPVGRFGRSLFASKFSTEFTDPYPQYRVEPWYYNPRWILVTTPLSYSVLFLAGIAYILARLRDEELSRDKLRYLVLLTLLLAPVIAPVAAGTKLFDGWRHHYFVYPVFLVFSLTGLLGILEKLKRIGAAEHTTVVRKTVLGLLALDMALTTFQMVSIHPHQYVYSNILAGPGQKYARYNGAVDYWMLSYREALEKILKEDPRTTIRVGFLRVHGGIIMILPPKDRARIVIEWDASKCDYYIYNFWGQKRLFPKEKEWYSRSFRGEKFLVVYKLRDA